MESLGLVQPEFWRNRRVFLTGHTGFKGAWLSLWLVEMGAQLSGYALAPPSEPSLFELAKISQSMTSIIGDIRNLPTLQTALQKAEPEIVIHMAAQSLVRPSYTDPLGTYATNVMGTAHVLETVRTCKSVRAVLIVTSDKCYENHEGPEPYRENDPMGGYDPYSSSKGCAELLTAAYRRSFFHPDHYAQHKVAVASARAGNVIGGGDWAEDRLIPDAMRAFLAGKPLDIRNPEAVRPWQHVLDPLNGYLQLCQKLLSDDGATFAESWNFGPDSESDQSVTHVLTSLKKLWGPEAVWKTTQALAQPHEARYLRLDCEKAKTKLGWRPLYDLDEALALTTTWYQAYRAKADLKTLTLAQIRSIGNAATPPVSRHAHA